MRRTTIVACLGGLLLVGGYSLWTPQVPPEVRVNELVEELQSGDDERGITAAKELADFGADAKAAIPELLKALESENIKLQVAAMQALGGIGPDAKAAIPVLVDRLDEEILVNGRPLWTYAATALGQMGESAVPPLMQVLDRSNRAQYRGVGSALHDIGPGAKAAVPALIEIVKTNDDDIIPAIYALQGIGAEARDAVPALTVAISNDDFHTQYWACRALGAIGPDAREAVPVLNTAVREGITSVRRNAAAALGNIGPTVGEDAVATLAEALDDPLQFVRDDAAKALGKIGPAAKSAVPRLREVLERESHVARAFAAGALYRIEPTPENADLSMRVLLREVQGDTSPWDASMELGYVAPQVNRIDDVVKLLDSKNHVGREFAAEALGLMGAHAKGALPRLNQLLADESENAELRESVRAAIARIEADVKQQ